MKVTVIFLSLSVFLVTIASVSSTVCTVTNYASPVSNYSKIVEPSGGSYTYWVDRCKGLGNGWDIARISNNVEYIFINQAHLSDYYQLRYFIGGRTEDLPSERVMLSQNLGFSNNGRFNVYATTDFGSLGFRSYLGNLNSALCEKATNQGTGQTFSSDTSYYNKLSGRRRTFSYWSSRCAELGEGWAPVVIETRRELDLIREATRLFTNIRTYFIGGYSSFGHFEDISPCSLDNSGPGSNRVIVSTFKRINGRGRFRRNAFKLVSVRPSRTIPGILCEKAKN